jgi:chlorite dismutase
MTAQQPGADPDAGERPCANLCVYPLLDSYGWVLLPKADRRTMRAEVPFFTGPRVAANQLIATLP